MSKISIAELNARIARRNKRFAKMTAAEKRVQIAKDVIDQLDMKRLIATKGTYLRSYQLEGKLDDGSNEEIATIFGGVKRCNVCAIGAAFMCAVEKLDALKVKDLSYAGSTMLDDDDMRKYLRATKAFTITQLRVLESVFEGWVPFQGFNLGVDSHDERLRRTMNFIIANEGRMNFPMDDCATLEERKEFSRATTRL